MKAHIRIAAVHRRMPRAAHHHEGRVRLLKAFGGIARLRLQRRGGVRSPGIALGGPAARGREISSCGVLVIPTTLLISLDGPGCTETDIPKRRATSSHLHVYKVAFLHREKRWKNQNPNTPWDWHIYTYLGVVEVGVFLARHSPIWQSQTE